MINIRKFKDELISIATSKNNAATKAWEIDNWFNQHVEEYSSVSTITNQVIDHMDKGQLDSYYEYQNRTTAAQMGEMALNRGTLVIEKIDPAEEYRLHGRSASYDHDCERRLAKMWVLK